MLLLYGADLSSPSNKVRFVLNALGREHEYKRVSIKKGENRAEDHLLRHPAGKIPVIDDDGFVLFESNAIVRYLADTAPYALYPQIRRARGLIDQWMDFISIHIGEAVNQVAFNRLFAPHIGREVDFKVIREGEGFFNRFLPVVDNQIKRCGYVSGQSLTIADMNLLATLDPLEACQMDIAAYPHVAAWRKKLMREKFYQQCHASYEDGLKAFLRK